MPDLDLAQTLAARLLSMGVARETSHATIRSSEVQALDTEVLRIVRGIATGAEPALDVGRTLGEGGMGIVHLGTQRALGREVALKTLRAEGRTDDAVSRLVREAVVTGSLEHPNIVPVHDLSIDADGLPVLAMKRIEGSTWTLQMKDGEGVRRLYGAADLLEWNLRTLASVCRAMHFAHARGVVHRDLKPDNVMVGRFGEVYVLDWGIAARVEGERQLDPSAGPVMGTPAYMAPEMILGFPVSARTDVYLLGGLLFEILTGRAPHDGPGTMFELAKSVLASPPPIPDGAPEELAALVRACMQREERDRLATAEDVRLGVEEFLRHRGASMLAAQAERRHAELLTALGETTPEPARIQRLYGEVTFGFRAALEAWPENAVARAGLDRAARAMLRYELAQGMTRAALARLADLPEPDETLRVEVEEAQRRVDEEASLAEAFRVEHDPRSGRSTRKRLMLIVGTLWTVAPLLEHFGLLGEHAGSHAGNIATAAVFLAVLVVGVVIMRDSVWKSRFNRQLSSTAAFILVAQILAYLGAATLGMDAATTQIVLLFLWFVVVGLLAVLFELRLLLPAFVFLGAFFVGAFDNHLRLLGEAAANFVLTVTAVLAWRNVGVEPRPLETSPQSRKE